MNSVKIIDGSLDNLDDIFNLEFGFVQDRYSRNLIIDMLNNKNNINLVISYDDKIVGYLTAGVVLDECELIKIIVDSGYRQNGLATLMLCELLDRVKKLGVNKIFLEVRDNNFAAKKLYEKIGFKKIYQREKYYKDGVDADIYWYSFYE